MAVDTPVLERISGERKTRECAVPSRMDFLAEDEHNARIKDTYARLINPDNKIEDVFSRVQRKETVVEEPKAQAVVEEQPAVRHSITGNHPYVVENARADAAIFRADSAINAKKEQAVAEVAQPAAVATPAEEESEDLRPTPTTIQYQTIGKAAEKKTVSSIIENSARTFGKREKIIVAVFVAVVVALVALVILNSAIINNLNASIAKVQESITTVRGAIAGVNSTVEDIIFNGMSH
ncbi:MAG: hypothetical protein K2K39_01220 [Clostridia bacterium]|nr:hypothetical protein [Clostridia bacterium]